MGEVLTPRRPHYCAMPTQSYTVTPPPMHADDPPGTPVTYQDLPPVGSVWRCEECGQHWRVDPSRYANVLMNHWTAITGWTYRRAVKRMQR